MWDWIITNISTLKDILWIVFTFAATIIALLTYWRARHTVLQPLRTEVIKRQTELLIDMLEFFDSRILFSLKLDYMNLTRLNMFMQIKEYGFDLDEKIIYEEIDNKIAGAFFKHDTILSPFAQKTKVFENEDERATLEDIYNKAIQQKKFEDARKGSVRIDGIYFTKQFFACSDQLNQFINNPFMPKIIKKSLKEIESDINYNLNTIMSKVIEDFVIEICSFEYSSDKKLPSAPNSDVLYSKFIDNSKHHEDKINKIREQIREYLMIDKKWN